MPPKSPPEDEHVELLDFALAPAMRLGVRLWAAIYYKETVSGDGVWEGAPPLFRPVAALLAEDESYQIECEHGVRGPLVSKTPVPDTAAIMDALPDCETCQINATLMASKGHAEHLAAEENADDRLFKRLSSLSPPKWTLWYGLGASTIGGLWAVLDWLGSL